MTHRVLLKCLPSMTCDKNKMAVSEASPYPLVVRYCGECTMPTEYCEYGGNYAKCKEWLKANHPEAYEEELEGGMEGVDLDEDAKSKQKRGGKAMKKAKKKVARMVKIGQAQRNKRKIVTIISGLATFEIDLKKASKQFSQRFSCGSSVTGDDEIVVQGEVAEDILLYIQEIWPEIDNDHVQILPSKKKSLSNC